MHIEGDYTAFAHLETPVLGTLARRTLITTNVVHVLEAANGKHDHLHAGAPRSPPRPDGRRLRRLRRGPGRRRRDRRHDDEQASWWGGRGIGTVPHALIARTAATPCSRRRSSPSGRPPDMNVTVLVDFENDSVRTALEVADALGERLWGVRLDTSESLVDRSLVGRAGRLQADRRQRAARVEGARRARRAGYERLRIVVSGGFTVEKISALRGGKGVPVDAYGVGSSLIRGSNDFTGRHRADGRQAVGQGRPAATARVARLERVDVKRILWDVDTQVDFMEPYGKLYVPGARDVAPAMEQLVDAARAARIVHVASADDHELTDPEISRRARLPRTRIRRTASAARAAPRRSSRRSSATRCRSRSFPSRRASAAA